MGQLVVSVITGFLLGGTYALIGLGLVQAFRATATFNFTHGHLMLLPAFLVATWQSNGTMPTWLAIAVALGIASASGVVLFVLVLRRTLGMPHFLGFAATIGAAAALQGILQIAFGAHIYSFDIPLVSQGRFEIAGIGVSRESVILAAVANIVAVAVALFMRFAEAGIRIRAAGQDPLLASQSGINVRRSYMASWALAGALAGLAGVIYGSTNLFTLSATGVALVAAPAIVLGGLDSFEGAIVGGLLIGLVQGFTTSYLGGEYTDVVTYCVLLVVLLVYPSGLFGTSAVQRL